MMGETRRREEKTGRSVGEENIILGWFKINQLSDDFQDDNIQHNGEGVDIYICSIQVKYTINIPVSCLLAGLVTIPPKAKLRSPGRAKFSMATWYKAFSALDLLVGLAANFWRH